MVGIGPTVDSNTVMMEEEVGGPMKVGCPEVGAPPVHLSHLLELGATVVLGMAGNHGVPTLVWRLSLVACQFRKCQSKML